MGLELALLPLDHYADVNGNVWGFSHQVIQVEQKYDLFDEIQKLEQTPLPEGADVSAYVGATISEGEHEGETMYGRVDETPYGDRITYVRVTDLIPLLVKHIPDHPSTAFMIAFAKWFYRGEPRVLLYWH